MLRQLPQLTKDALRASLSLQTHLFLRYAAVGVTLRPLLRAGAGSLGLQLGGVLLSLALSVLLARLLGPDDFGAYAYVYALVSLLAIPAQFGLPTLVIRETAKAQASGQWGLMRGVWQWAGVSACALTLLLVAAGGASAWAFASRFTRPELLTFAWGLALVPLVVLGTLRGAALTGLRKVVQGQVPERIVRPLLLVLFLAAMWLTDRVLGAAQAMALHVLAAGIAFLLGGWLLRRELPFALRQRIRSEYRTRQWLKSVLPLAMVDGMWLVMTKTDIVMLGWFAPARDVGIYRVASAGAVVVTLGLAAVGMVTMPYFARFHQLRDMDAFQYLATIAARWAFVLALPVVVLFAIFGTIVIHLTFGSAYVSAQSALTILALGQLVTAGFGTVAPLLNMAGYERDTAIGIAIAAVCNVALNLVLIPAYGVNGAAVATSLSLVAWNVILWRAIRIRLRVDSSCLGLRVRSASAAVSKQRSPIIRHDT